MRPDCSRLGRVLEGGIRIDEVIGSGGMGVVYKGTKLPLGRSVAVKWLPGTGDIPKTHIKSFMREAKVLSRLRHPHIVSVLDSGNDKQDGALYLVLEYIPGDSLEHLLDKVFPLPHERTLKILIQVLSALEEAHRHGVIHRDLKPANVLLEQVAGKGDFVKVVDFGIAKNSSPDGSALSGGLSVMGGIMGTPRYMSPEQVLGVSVDARCDVYSVGVLLYEMLTGKVPHESEDLHEMLRQRARGKIILPSTQRPDLHIPKEFDEICARATRLRRAERYASAAHMRQALQNLLRDLSVQHRSVTAPPRHTPFPPGSEVIRTGPLPGAGAKRFEGTALVLRPGVSAGAGGFVGSEQTSAERVLIVWDYIERFVDSVGGQMSRTDGGMAVACFEGDAHSTLGLAARSALKLQDKVSRHFGFACLAVGVAHGELAWLPGKTRRLRGKAALMARTLLSGATENDIMVSAQAKVLLAEGFHLQPREEAFVIRAPRRPGVQSDAIRPLSRKTDNLLSAPPSIEVPGRPRLQKRLEYTLGRLRQGHSVRPLALIGEPGTGRRYALAAMTRQLASDGVLVVRTRVSVIDKPFRPLMDLVFQLLAQVPGVSTDAGRSTSPASLEMKLLLEGAVKLGLSAVDTDVLVGQWVSGQGDEGLGQTDRASGLSHTQLHRLLHSKSPRSRRMELTAAVRRLMVAILARRKVVVVLEDLQEADAMSLAALEGLCALASDHPLFLATTASHADLEVLRHFELHKVEPLAGAALGACWEAMCVATRHQSQLPLREVAQASKGLPLYMRRWLGTPGLDAGTLPALIIEQLKQLPVEERRVLTMACVLGPSFDSALLKELIGTLQSKACEALCQGPLQWFELLPDKPGWWRFVHPRLRRVLYRHLSSKNRRELHRRVYDLMANRPTNDTQQAALATHAFRGELWHDALKLAVDQGDRWMLSRAPEGAARWFLIALKAQVTLGTRGHEREMLTLKAAMALRHSEQDQKALQLLERCEFEDVGQRARAALMKFEILKSLGRLKAAQEHGRAALEQSLDIPALAGVLLVHMGDVYQRRNKLNKALEIIAKGRELFQQSIGLLPADVEAVRWNSLILISSIYAQQNNPQEAERFLRDAMKEARLMRDMEGIFACLSHLASLLMGQRRYKDLERLCKSLLANPPSPPNLPQQVVLWRILGQVHQATEDTVSARVALTRARSLAEEGGWLAAVETLNSISRNKLSVS